MRVQMWPGTRKVKLRRNTSKHGFDVLLSSDKVPTCRSPVGRCFTLSSGKLAHASDKLPHLPPISLVSIWRHRTSRNSFLTKPR